MRLLRRARNRLRNTLVPFVYRKIDAERITTVHERVEHPFSETRAEVSDGLIAEAYDRESRSVDHIERISVVDGDYVIDPTSGFVRQRGTRNVLRDAIIYDHPSVYPDLMPRRTRTEVKIPECVQFDHHWGITYFHFYSDVLHKLAMLDTHPSVVPDVPLVVSRRTFESKWFRFFRQFSFVAGRNWRVQEAGEVIRSERVWLLRPMPFEPSYWQGTRALVSEYRQPVSPTKRVFVNRPAKIGRYLRNVDQLLPALHRAGFQIVELDNARMEEQIALFSSASLIVTMHGAALTNLIFSSAPTRVLELMPGEAISCHYYWVAKVMELGGYDAVLGGPLETNLLRYPRGRFDVDPDRFEQRLRRALDESS